MISEVVVDVGRMGATLLGQAGLLRTLSNFCTRGNNNRTLAGKVKSFFHKSDLRHYFNGISPMAPTAKERATITLHDASQQL